MALPMVNEAKEAYPAAHLTVLAPDNLSDLYISNPAIDEIISIPKKYVHGMGPKKYTKPNMCKNWILQREKPENEYIQDRDPNKSNK